MTMRLAAATLLIGSVLAAGCDRQVPAGSTASNELASAPASGTKAEDTAGAAASGLGAASGMNTQRAGPWREVTIPAGTLLPIVLETAVGSDISRVEEPVHARLAHAVMVNGVTALPEGSPVSGVVTNAERSGKVKGVAHVAVRFNSLSPRGDDERYRIETSSVARSAAATKKDDAV